MTLRRLGLTAVGAMAVPAMLAAQQAGYGVAQANRAPDKDAAQIMITSFKSQDKAENDKKEKGVSYLAADEMRRKVESAFPYKQVYVVPVERINPNLVASQFSTTEGLEIHDARQLGVMLRADEFIMGTAEKTAAGYKVTADMVLTRDVSAKQPLGVGEAPKLGDAVNILVKEMKEARKQSDGEKKCTNAARDGKFPEAIAFADAAILAYPKATLARMCKLAALGRSKAPTDQIAKVARELSDLDPRSNVGLIYLADVYRAKKDDDSLVVVLTNLLRNDPKNSDLQIKVINEIAGMKNVAMARPIIDSAVVLNPGDPDLIKLQWQILNAVRDFKEMNKVGAELIRLDTAFADTLYFARTAGGFAADSQFQKAAEAAAMGLAKFPGNPTLAGAEIAMLRSAGQLQPALDKIRKAKTAKTPVPNLGALEMQTLMDLGKMDEAIPLAKEAIAAGDTTTALRQMVLNSVQQQFTNAQKLMAADAVKAQEDLMAVLTELPYAESIAKPGQQKAQVSFVTGAANLTIANIKLQAAIAQKACQPAKDAKPFANQAMISLPGGAGFAQAAQVQQLMGSAMQVDGGLDQVIKAYCKP